MTEWFIFAMLMAAQSVLTEAVMRTIVICGLWMLWCLVLGVEASVFMTLRDAALFGATPYPLYREPVASVLWDVARHPSSITGIDLYWMWFVVGGGFLVMVLCAVRRVQEMMDATDWSHLLASMAGILTVLFAVLTAINMQFVMVVTTVVGFLIGNLLIYLDPHLKRVYIQWDAHSRL